MFLNKVKYLPFLLLTAISPVLFLFANNLNELNYGFLWLPMIFAFMVALILFFILNLFIKDSIKAILLASLIVILFFSYGHFRNLILNGLKVSQESSSYLFIIWFGLMVLCSFFLYNKSGPKFFNFFKFFSLFFVAIPLVNIGLFELKQSNLEESKVLINSSDSQNLKNYPDIYYIIPDEYPSIEILDSVFDYRNGDFLNFLNQSGFQVPRKSTSNYVITFFSLASTLNMKYLDELSKIKKPASDDFSIPQQMIENNEVSSFLKEKGYTFIAFNSGYPMSSYNKYADIQFDGSIFDRFMILVLRSSMLQPLYSRKEIFGFSGTNELRKRILYNFDKLAEVPNIPGPKFVFFHVVSPHPPFLFDRNGKKINIMSMVIQNLSEEEYKKFFLGQLMFTNKKLESSVETILSKSSSKPIIIIQSDHGFGFSGDFHNSQTLNDPKMRAKNFSAFLLPGINKNILPEDISTVNSFRFVFDQYFGTDFGILENKNYIYNPNDPYDFNGLVQF